MQGPFLLAQRSFRLSRWAAIVGGMIVATYLPANADSLATRTLEHCSDLESYGPDVVGEFFKLGWAPVNDKTRKDTLAVLADGLIIASATYRQSIDWSKQIADAKELTTFLAASTPDLYTVFASVENGKAAALVIFHLEMQEEMQVRCNYSGPSDTGVTSLIDTIVEMDRRIGVSPGDPAFELVTINQNGSGATRISTQIARYTTAPVELGRAPLAEVGFSIIVTTGR